MSTSKYHMTIDLNVLNHLGINLYSNIPAVLAEAVSNAWDADAENVSVKIDLKKKSIVIEDDGHGMSEQDINDKFLRVGYQRREAGEGKTPKFNRPVMGRKGIGKLSLFSIADTIEIQSVRDGQKNGFIMSLPAIREQIKGKRGEYNPQPLENDDLKIEKGTRITLRDFRKRITHTEKALRKRLARRFSIAGSDNDFSINVNGDEIKVTDRDYFHKLQYVWHYGEAGAHCVKHCNNAEKEEARTSEPFLSGWIGTVKEVGSLKDDGENLNRIVVMVRGKLAQEDILESFGEGGMYANYLMGEIHADFLDEDDKDDIATSSRQSIIEDDPRFISLRDAIQRELKYIQNQWTKFRNEAGEKTALEVPVIKNWFGELGSDDKKRARSLFGKINQLTIDDAEQRQMLFKHGVLAFESLKAKQNLDALESISAENLVQFSEIFGHLDDLEATLYHQIIAGRINVVRALQGKVEDDALEKVVQEHLFNHLWLLDPSWERATSTEYMEQRVETEFGKITNTLSKEEREGRIDIKYRTTGGKHVIIELKRASVKANTDILCAQVKKYRTALKKILIDLGKVNDQIEIVCVVGKPLADWDDPDGRQISNDQFKAVDARVILYQELIENSFKAYKDFLDQSKEAGRVFKLLRAIEESI